MKAKKITLISSFALALFLCITSFTNSTIQTSSIPQDDPNVGFYVDGIKVDSINCYEFQDLKIVFLWNDEWSTYDYLKISLQVGDPRAVKKGLGRIVEKAISIRSIINYKKGNYVVYSIYGKDKAPIDMCIKPNQPYLLPADQANSPTKGDLQYDGAVKKGKPSDNAVLNIYLTGLTFQGEIEEFNPSCNCLQKYKKYNPIDLKNEYMLVLTNRLTGGNKERWKETDLSNPCTYSGTKVDFNNLK